MVSPRDNVRRKPCVSSGEDKISVLVIDPGESGCAALEAIFRAAGWYLSHARNCGEALDSLDKNPMKVVICEGELPGSGWKDVLVAIGSLPQPPLLIVTSRMADDSLWAEVLNLGGYDVLVQPFEREEVVRVIGAARRHFESQLTHRRAAAHPAISA